MNYERIEFFYNSGLWSVQMVKMAVRKGIITKEQFTEITGQTYA